MGLLYPQSTWCHHLWQGHVTRFASAQTVLADGTARQPAFPGLAQDMHDSLYLRHTPEPLPVERLRRRPGRRTDPACPRAPGAPG